MSRKAKKVSNTKKFIILGVTAALIASTLAVVYRPPSQDQTQDNSKTEQEEQTKAFFCGSGFPNSNRYIQEYVLPTKCGEPVAITVAADGSVWFAESAARKIGMFNPVTKEFKEFALPGSEEKKGAESIASIWTMKFDKSGMLWFPDVSANAIWKLDPEIGKFEMYRIPSSSQFGTSYPINFDFDSVGRIWFSEIYGKNIGVLDPALAKHGTSEGMTEISTGVNLETLGPMALDSNGNVWFTALTYPSTGRLMKLDPTNKVFTAYSMPEGISSPVGIAPDELGNLWINDHGTSAFVKFNPEKNSTAVYATSLPLRTTSIGLFEKCLAQPGGSPITCAGYPVSLPYWNTVDGMGRVWFNEHQGNSIAVFDPATEVLVEYFVPSQNLNWGDCENYLEPCGIANPLQFAHAPDGKVWFTEWTESKIGVLDPDLLLPLSLDIPTEKPYVVANGESLAMNIAVTAKERLNSIVQMRVSGTIIPAGKLFNMTAEFSEPEISFSEPATKNVTLKLVPENGLAPGNYRITVSARYNEATYSKLVEITVMPSRL